MQVGSLNWEDPLEEVMTTHSSTLVWRIPMDRGAWGWLQLIGSQRVRHDKWLSMHTHALVPSAVPCPTGLSRWASQMNQIHSPLSEKKVAPLALGTASQWGSEVKEIMKCPHPIRDSCGLGFWTGEWVIADWGSAYPLWISWEPC